ncbi:unnamed protein product [Trichogramma brassicae]|uniref:Uncharacterized protein n=1 Tax=Trichogramma brassicae TaxID=86971 RepID=A0A6H5IIC2_9HYME|nr:unnamed protein product [Trichogramma brassicae]
MFPQMITIFRIGIIPTRIGTNDVMHTKDDISPNTFGSWLKYVRSKGGLENFKLAHPCLFNIHLLSIAYVLINATDDSYPFLDQFQNECMSLLRESCEAVGKASYFKGFRWWYNPLRIGLWARLHYGIQIKEEKEEIPQNVQNIPPLVENHMDGGNNIIDKSDVEDITFPLNDGVKKPGPRGEGHDLAEDTYNYDLNEKRMRNVADPMNSFDLMNYRTLRTETQKEFDAIKHKQEKVVKSFLFFPPSRDMCSGQNGRSLCLSCRFSGYSRSTSRIYPIFASVGSIMHIQI